MLHSELESEKTEIKNGAQIGNSLDPDALGRLSTELAECWNVVWSLMLSRQLL